VQVHRRGRIGDHEYQAVRTRKSNWFRRLKPLLNLHPGRVTTGVGWNVMAQGRFGGIDGLQLGVPNS
jgi:hypothetical protein